MHGSPAAARGRLAIRRASGQTENGMLITLSWPEGLEAAEALARELARELAAEYVDAGVIAAHQSRSVAHPAAADRSPRARRQARFRSREAVIQQCLRGPCVLANCDAENVLPGPRGEGAALRVMLLGSRANLKPTHSESAGPPGRPRAHPQGHPERYELALNLESLGAERCLRQLRALASELPPGGLSAEAGERLCLHWRLQYARDPGPDNAPAESLRCYANVAPPRPAAPGPVAAPDVERRQSAPVSRRAFAHPSERIFARILDFYHIRWEYEPRTFALRHDAEGRLIEAFTPDFYLPEQDLFIELTTMKQSLVTRKNRKLRRLAELHPEVRVRMVYQKDFEDLIFRLGLPRHPSAETNPSSTFALEPRA